VALVRSGPVRFAQRTSSSGQETDAATDWGRVGVEQAAVTELRASLHGEVIDRLHPGYDQARKVWNGLIDRHPAAIARCAETADVVEAVRIAHERRPTLSIRGGGHQVAGSAVCDDGLVIDLSAMRGVQVDLGAGRVWAQGGVTWGELDRETQVFGLATTGGEVSTTGIAGFTLGGGLGVLMRAYGLACDNLRSIKIVTADGAVRTASRHENADLFWAARGGGRGLGVVTSFEFDLHPLGSEVAAAQVLYRFEEAPRVVRAFRNTALESPDEVAPELFLWSVPADPEIPEDLHGSPVVYVGAVYAGPADEAEAALAPLRSLGPPLLDTTGLFPYVELQSGADEAFPVGGRYYMKSHFLDELSDAGIDTLLEWYAQRPTAETLIAIRTLGGAVARVGDAESAFAHRSARFNLSIDATWVDPAMDEVAIGWARSTWQEMRAFSNGGVYLNFSGLDAEAEDLRGAVQGSNELRLAEIRHAYDPQGVFAAAAGRP
jgi:FAD/FMN-containing dehydrogenase